jgi:hypothetical protein
MGSFLNATFFYQLQNLKKKILRNTGKVVSGVCFGFRQEAEHDEGSPCDGNGEFCQRKVIPGQHHHGDRPPPHEGAQPGLHGLQAGSPRPAPSSGQAAN